MSHGTVSITLPITIAVISNMPRMVVSCKKKCGDDVIFFANRVVFDDTASMAMTFKTTNLQILSFSRVRFEQIVSC